MTSDADCESNVCINKPPVAYPKRADGKVGQGEVVCRDGEWVTEETQMQSGFVTATADFYENPKNVKWGFSIHNRPMCATHPASARGSHSPFSTLPTGTQRGSREDSPGAPQSG